MTILSVIIACLIVSFATAIICGHFMHERFRDDR